MSYRVILDFADLQDHRHLYRAGDEYPRPGIEADPARIAELNSRNNKRGVPLIEKAKARRKKSAD